MSNILKLLFMILIGTCLYMHDSYFCGAFVTYCFYLNLDVYLQKVKLDKAVKEYQRSISASQASEALKKDSDMLN